MKLSFNVLKKAKQVIAWFLRKTLMLEWIQVLTKPITKINDDLVKFKDEVTRLYHKSYETVAFESFLNDEFDGDSDTSRDGFPDTNQRRIVVKNNPEFNELMTSFLISEDQKLPASYTLAEVNDPNSNITMEDLPATYLLSEEFGDYDFIVEVPTGVFSQAQLNEMAILIEGIKLDIVSFNIKEV